MYRDGERRRRSETRLGPQVLEGKPPGRSFSLQPLIDFWEGGGKKIIDLLLLAGLIWGTIQLFQREEFFVYQATTVGNSFVPAEEIFAASHLEEMSIFYINPRKVKASLEQIPNIKRAKVICRLPNRVTLQVEEYQPRFIWQSGQDECWVSREGVFVPVLAELRGLVRIIDTDRQPVSLGKPADERVLRTVEWLEPWVKDRTFQLSQAKGISFIDEEGRRIYFGFAEHLEMKMVQLRALEEEAKAKGLAINYIDLSIPGNLYYRLFQRAEASGQKS